MGFAEGLKMLCGLPTKSICAVLVSAMAEESSLSQQIRTVERSVVFLRQEHLSLLHGLHLEILSLQKRCSGEEDTPASALPEVFLGGGFTSAPTSDSSEEIIPPQGSISIFNLSLLFL